MQFPPREPLRLVEPPHRAVTNTRQAGPLPWGLTLVSLPSEGHWEPKGLSC